MHKLLERQLKKARRGTEGGAVELDVLLDLVDAAYGEFDRQRCVLTHTHNVMREEHGQLNARLSRLRDGISQMGAGFSIWDSEDRLVLCNKRLQEILSHIAGDIQPGVAFADLVRRATPFIYSMSESKGSDAWVAARVERHRNPTGEPFEVAFTNGRYVQVWEEKTGEGGIVSLYFDITDRKRAEDDLRRAKEAAESANHSKSQFLANMSHELRTPLNAVLGFSETMLHEVLGPLGDRRYLDYAKDIHSAGSHLLDIISDILDMSKIEAGHVDLDAQWIDVANPIGAALRLIDGRAREAGLTLFREVEPNLPPFHADPRLIKQILLNLLSNAVKFTPPGGKVTVGAALMPGGGLALRVSDTGLGIAAKDIPLALKPFGQIELILSRKHGGVGLGLPLSKRLIELHGGMLEIASVPGSGTSVSVYFPPERVGRAAAAAS